MIEDNYLHVQRWRHNFLADSVKVTMLPVLVRFPWLLVEYYIDEWLRKAGDMIGKTIKVDDTTLASLQGKFAGVCAEIDLDKLLLASFWTSNTRDCKTCVSRVASMAIKS